MGQLRVDGHPGQQGQTVFIGGLLGLALAEGIELLPAVGTGDIAHVLHQAHNGDVHHLGHFHGLLHHHAHQLLGAGHDDDAVHRQGLEHVQGYVAGSGRHIHEHIVHVLPQHVPPELLHHAADDGAAPDDGVSLVLQQQIYAHQLDAGAGDDGEDGILGGRGPAMDTEGLGDGGTGDVGVQHRHIVAPALHGDGQLAGDHGLADAALAGHHAVNLADPAALPQGLDLEGAAPLALGAAFTAAAAIVGTIAHNQFSFIIML